MENENDTTVAIWESRGHKYRVELYRGNIGWSYREFTNGRPGGFGCWPALGLDRDNEARYGLVNFGRRLRAGSFQADNSRTPMVRIDIERAPTEKDDAEYRAEAGPAISEFYGGKGGAI